MKILHVVEPFSSGIITFIIHLTRELDHHEHTVLHGTRTTADEEQLVRNRFVKQTKFLRWRHANRKIHFLKDILAFIELYRIIKFGNYDFIHLHSAKAGFLGSLCCFILKKKAVIYTPNGAPFLRTDVSRIKRRLFIGLEKLACRIIGGVVCCSESEKLEYDRYGMKTMKINNGTIISKRERISHEKIIIGFVGIATFQKQPKVFASIAKAFKTNDNVHFVWVGDGDMNAELDVDFVEQTGWLQPEEIEHWFSKIDVFLSCSLWEGLPFAVMEAMTYQSCLVLSDCVGNKDLIVQGRNGYLYNSIDEAIRIISSLIEDREKIKELGISSLELCKKEFNVLDTAKLYDRVYSNKA